MTRDKLYDEATKVTAKDGEVILDGPDAVDVKITPRSCRRHLREHGHSTECAERLLLNLEDLLRMHREHLDRIRSQQR
jgi:hypothetical protein